MPLEPRLLELAERLIDFIKTETGSQVVVCDETGTIVRATIRSRIGTIHAGAQAILRSDISEYAVTKEESQANPLVREGLNLPIIVDARRVGTFGIAGSPFLARPVARVCALLITAWLKEARQGHAPDEETGVPRSGSHDGPDRSALATQLAEQSRVVRAVGLDLARVAKDVRKAAAVFTDIAIAIDHASQALCRCVANAPELRSGPGDVRARPRESPPR
jgi:Putative sugar diacid recognition